MADDTIIIVAAIDFGTTFSGYAFSMTGTPNDIVMNKNWGSSLSFQSYKTATSVLTDENDEFLDFGFDAENKYSAVLESKIKKTYHLYRHFKMLLHKTKEVSERSIVTSLDGKECNAMLMFTYALEYMKKHVLDAIQQNLPNVLDTNIIRWVVTVPAIWSEESKQFMRKAAFKAGLISTMHSSKLLIALEPEAASLCCRQLELTKENLTAGTKYMVIDAGGGTVDITAHEVLESGGVKELYIASGGAWGGTQVDANFLQLMYTVIGKEFIEKYQAENPKDSFGILMNFEKSKKAFSPDEICPINVPLAWSIGGSYAEFTNGGNLQRCILENGADHGVEFSNGTLIVSHESSRRLFQQVLDKVVHHVNSLLNDHKEHPMSYFFLVGGFSESKLFQETMKKELVQNTRVVIPSDAQMAVLKGAVLFGHRPHEIGVRIARRTYGCEVTEKFKHTYHKESKKIKVDGEDFCDDVFCTLVEKGEQIKVEDKRNHIFGTTSIFQQKAETGFYSIDHKARDPQYVDDNDVEKLGTGITVKTPGLGAGRPILLSLTFGGTEIKAEAKDVLSGSVAETTLNFLS